MLYKTLEDNGIMMPVLSMNIKYIKPAFYDDILSIETFIKESPLSRIIFKYEVRNQNAELINKGETILAFVDKKIRKIVKALQILLDKMVI